MLRRPFDLFEQAACTLARSAQPIQQRLGMASAIVREVKPDDLGCYQELRESFESVTSRIAQEALSREPKEVDFSHLSDEAAEQLAAELVDAFVSVARIHLSTR